MGDSARTCCHYTYLHLNKLENILNTSSIIFNKTNGINIRGNPQSNYKVLFIMILGFGAQSVADMDGLFAVRAGLVRTGPRQPHGVLRGGDQQGVQGDLGALGDEADERSDIPLVGRV